MLVHPNDKKKIKIYIKYFKIYRPCEICFKDPQINIFIWTVDHVIWFTAVTNLVFSDAAGSCFEKLWEKKALVILLYVTCSAKWVSSWWRLEAFVDKLGPSSFLRSWWRPNLATRHVKTFHTCQLAKNMTPNVYLRCSVSVGSFTHY